MADEPPMNKRRRQNRDSQRRFRERNKTRRSWSISSANQVRPHIASSAPLASSSSSTSSEHATSYIPSDEPSLLSLESLPPASNEWTGTRGMPTPTHREDVLYRQTQHYNCSSSVPQLSLPPFSTQFSLDEISMPSTNGNTNYHHQQDFGPIRQVAGSSKGGFLSPISLLDADLRINIQPSGPTRSEEALQPYRRTSASRAEQMISDVENLYDFGISLSIFPEDLSLRNSLRRMKERFRSLVKVEVPCDQRSAVNDMYEDSSEDGDSDE